MFFVVPYGKNLFTLPMHIKKQSIPTIMWNVEPDKFIDVNNPG